ncbi:hypothetical protein GGP41_007216 [Bipolaris sorokiniana]|uniref:Uncharacterized protein n=2 Tax=Cochliobolus sativus TaxID=45130 RepID=A0A8H5ZU50_COCSA|nr:uncharacterized protein COCSADRAFT_352167 [Bipolaris sorokiniana ND90Pr]EMD67303.1 hypothetical protein COCSADRAFT_352167 [Bipolaris sorokiniana ND90Pr]KAF5854360.1 hypothetical protein GGP41_007216 [Bipolaris sorokiniana]
MQSTSETRSHELGEAGETARSGESSSFFFDGEMQDSGAEPKSAAAWGQERREMDLGEQQQLDGLWNGSEHDATNPLGSAAMKLEPRHWTNDLEGMDVDDGGIHSSALPHVSESKKEPLQGPTEKMQLGFEGRERVKYPGFVEGQHEQGHPSSTPTKAANSQRQEGIANPGFKDQTTTYMGGPQGYQTLDFTNPTPLHHSTPKNPMSFSPFNTYAPYNPSVQKFPQQQLFTRLNQPSFNPSFARQQQLQVQIDNKKRQIENVKRIYERNPRQAQQANNDFGFSQNQANVPASILKGPLSYQRAPQSAYQTLPFGNSSTKYPSHSQSEFPYDQMASMQPPALYSVQGHDALNQTSKPNQQSPSAYTTSEAPEEETKEETSSDDDEPLKTRLARHPSKAPSPHPPNTSPINWKLPDYDIQFSPSPPPASSSSSKLKATKDSSSLPVAKISLPGLIREPLVLSPDHTAQELHLLTHIFLPAQQALATPDPEPALAVLNFHSIAMMVVEAYVQFEIGDEMGRSGPAYLPPHDSASDEGERGKEKGKAKRKEEKDYVRIRCARNANVDDIFFAVIDRWRAGLESNKQSFKLIRGIQEFVDVALDVIFWIKENGLLVEEEGRTGEGEEGAKGKGGAKAGAKGKAEEECVKKEEGISMLTARKKTVPKAKVAKPKKKEAPVKKRRVPVTPGVTVVRKK